MSNWVRNRALQLAVGGVLAGLSVVASLLGLWQVAVAAIGLIAFGMYCFLAIRDGHIRSVHANVDMLRRDLSRLAAEGAAVAQLQATLEEVQARIGSGLKDVASIAQALARMEPEIGATRSKLDGGLEDVATLRDVLRRVESTIEGAKLEEVGGAIASLSTGVAEGRRLEGERHARTRKLLNALVSDGVATRTEMEKLYESLDVRERRLLGTIASERLKMHDRHVELLRLVAPSEEGGEVE